MNEPLREIEGTWEEVMTHEAELHGHQVKLTVLDLNNTSHTNTDVTVLPRGSYGRILQGLHLADLESGINKSDIELEEGDLWDVISAERARWRKLAQEKSE